MNNSQKYFDPETLARIQPLGLRAKTLVEGLVAGLHRSPLRGHSIEFAQHREYVPGDDLRQVDWKVFARSDRYYLKQYEDETNLRVYLLLDQSESMSYRGEDSPLSKLEYAQLCVCCLSYLTITQQDSAGLVTFSADIEHWLPDSSSPSHMDDIIRVLESAKSSTRTSIGGVVKEVVQRLSRPSLLILLSDMFDDTDEMLSALRLARFAGHDLIVLQVLDREEIEFPFDQMSQFEGLEETSIVTTDPLMIASAYRKAVADFQLQLESHCRKHDADYHAINTSNSLAHVLPQVLAERGRREL